LLANHSNRTPKQDLALVDAVIFMGNNQDIDPSKYGQKPHPETKSELATVDERTPAERSASQARAKYEEELMAAALDKKVPILGVCGGMQRLNVLCGGTLHQHIPDLKGVEAGHPNNEGQPPHTPVIPVTITQDTTLARIAGKTQSIYTPGVTPEPPIEGTNVNSFHHQALDKVANGFKVSASSDAYTRADGTPDKLVEAIEPDPKGKFKDQFIIGIQWHPEFMPQNPLTPPLVQSIVKEGQEFAKQQGRVYPPDNVLNAIVEVENQKSGLAASTSTTPQKASLAPATTPTIAPKTAVGTPP
jgi:putative glutamine amidotransferase